MKITGFLHGRNHLRSEVLITMGDVVEHLQKPGCDAVWVRLGRRNATILSPRGDGVFSVSVEGPGHDSDKFHQFTNPLMAAYFATSAVRSR